MTALEALAAIFSVTPDDSHQLILSCARCLSQITASETAGRVIFTCSGGCTEDELMGALAEVEPQFADWWLNGGLTQGALERPESHDFDENGGENDGRGIKEGIPGPDGDGGSQRHHFTGNDDNSRDHGADPLETEMARHRSNGPSSNWEDENVAAHNPEDNGPHLNGQVSERHPDLQSWKMMLYALGQQGIEKLIAQGYREAIAAQDIDAFVTQVERLRNLPKIWQTNDPQGLSETEIAEEATTVAVALRDHYAPIVESPNGAIHEIQLPDLTKAKLESLTWAQMRERRLARRREWIVSGKLARGETSSWSGKVEAGKTTLMRELTLCVLRGEPFLGCETRRGRVAYVMLDADGEEVTFDAFDEMGFTDDDGRNCLFVFETMLAQMDHGLEQLVKRLMDFGPALVIVDPYPRLKQIEDFHSYTNTYLMALLSHVAQMVSAHFALPGHIPRGRDDDADTATAGFGSIAFSGGVNARFKVIDRHGTHTITSSKGKGAGFEPFDAEYTLVQDPITHRMNLGQPWSWKDKARSYKDRVLEFLDDHADRPFDVLSLAKEIRVQRSVVRTAAHMLFGEQKIRRTGDGLKSDPFIFASLGFGGPMTMEEVKRG